MIRKNQLEHHGQKVLSPREFRRRLAGFVVVASAVSFAALGIGMLGYHFFEDLSWTDSFLNASMILSGMGPVEHETKTEGGKIFAGVYSLFSGIVFLAVAGLVFGPLIHRLLHKFHFDEDEVEDPEDDPEEVETEDEKKASSAPRTKRAARGQTTRKAPAKAPRGKQR